MATRRMITRLQNKKHNSVARNECSPAKKQCSDPLIDGVDNVNILVERSASLNKSYPQGHEISTRKMSKRKIFKTENPGKQRQTLSERGVNCSKPSVVVAPKKTECKAKEGGEENDCCENESLILIDTPIEHKPVTETNDSTILFDTPIEHKPVTGTGHITHEEITQLEEHTTVEEMICQEALAAALPPLVKENGQNGCPQTPSLDTDTTMECDTWNYILQDRRGSTPLPPGVVDIDKDPNNLDTCVYSHDIMEYLMMMEMRYLLQSTFLDTSPEVTPRMRGVLMDWLIQVQVHEELEEETLHMCVSLIDHYLASVKVHMPRLQLIGITCLLISAKVLERFAPEITTLCYLTANSFKRSQVIRYEIQVLVTLAFELPIAVPVTFLRRYLQVHERQQPKEVSSLAYYILDLSITSSKLAVVLPSKLAASAVYLARRLVLDTSQAWTASLAHYTYYPNPSALCDVVNELANLVYKAPTSKFQGARNKYNTEEHCFISYSWITQPATVESHFMTTDSSV